MSDPVKKFGDAALARKVLEAYVDGVEALTEKECKAMGISTEFPQKDCTFLSGTLDPSFEWSDILSPDMSKEKALVQQNFFDEFIRVLTGPAANRALQARARWLADHLDWNALASLSPENSEAMTAYKTLDELKKLGRQAMPVLPELLPRLKTFIEQKPWMKDTAMKVVAAIEFDGSARAEHLAQFCRGEKGDLGDLIAGLLSKEKKEKKCATLAIHLMLEGDFSIPNNGVGLIRQAYRRLLGPDGDEYIYDDANEPLRLALVKMIGHLETPTDEALDFLEEVLRGEEKRWPRRERESYVGYRDISNKDSPTLAAICEFFLKFGAASIPTILRLSGNAIFSMENRSLELLRKITPPKGYKGYSDERVLASSLVESLKSPDAALKEGARRLIFQINFETASPYLLSALEEEDVELRKVVITIFERRMSCDRYWYSEKVLTDITRRLADKDPEVRKTAAAIVGSCGVKAKNALPLLVAMRLNDDQETCRVAAKTAIENIEKGVL